MNIPLEIRSFTKGNQIDMTDTRNGEIWPSSKIMFEFKKYRKEQFEVAYSSTLSI